jgi:eight-cysteine-cluster-containing protein
MAIPSWTTQAGAVLFAALLFACAPETDRERYEVGENGVVTFHNQTSEALYLGGCGHFVYEQRIGDAWVSQGPDAICVWEGFAEPVPPDGVVTDPIHARAPGTWRLRYPVGYGCNEAAPLGDGHCAGIVEITSNEFEVLDTSCVVGGCSGQLCADEPLASTCEWRPHYACFREAHCGRFGPARSCGWEQTPELAACLERLGAGGDPIATPR